MKDLHLKNDPFFLENVSAGLPIRFRHYDMGAGKIYEEQNNEYNYLVFLLEGELTVSYNEFINIKVAPRSFYLIPKSSELVVKSLSWSNGLVFMFETLEGMYDKPVFQAYWKIASQHEQTVALLPIHYVLNDYLDLLLRYMRNGVNCPKMDKVKTQELFLLLQNLYTKEEIANLFHPILGKSLTFKEKILQNYQDITSVDELAGILGMGRTNFDVKFKKEFGMPPLQWMLKEKAKRVRFSMAESDITLSDIMQKYNFNSPTHLNRFCKQQFGCSPTELMKKLNMSD
ncbi:MAG: AraC family transcriptional regulator [Tannerellaceae bacterium]|jgi:AraC-like DNA-binding protein|nr:AraC family transcriptional regulator [Tannerellaceae bacterium]